MSNLTYGLHLINFPNNVPGSLHYLTSISVYDKNNYSSLEPEDWKKLTSSQTDTFNNMLISAEMGYEQAINLVLRDIFTKPGLFILSERKLTQMLNELKANHSKLHGFIYFLLGDLEAEDKNTPMGVIQNWYRKSMECGCILGKIKFAGSQYSEKYYSVALRHYFEILDHPDFCLLSNKWQASVYNDISLCYYYKSEKKYFWKYNKRARELGFPVAKNNAANGYFRGDCKRVNLTKALKLYEEALSDKDYIDKNDYTKNQVKTIKSKLESIKQ